jgi:hypothetical protein
VTANIHYNVWFSFRSGVAEADGLAVIHSFLAELRGSDEIAEFRLLKNTGAAAKTKLLPFHAVIEFRDDAQFSTAFSTQAARGIHTGLHGRMLSVVDEFQIEVFRQIAAPESSSQSSNEEPPA